MDEVPVYLRDCFACGKPMMLNDATKFLWCADCEVSEDGTVQTAVDAVTPFTWGGEEILFTDHSAVHLPSPDMGGISMLRPG